MEQDMSAAATVARSSRGMVTMFLCGDVMTGRGIDQILSHPSKPQIYESYMKSALGYLYIAERENGPIGPLPVKDSYIWGDALSVLDRVNPHARIINLETSVTQCDKPWPGKGIQYRMHPDNVGCLTSARIDCCTLANNHTLDWSREGLEETVHTLQDAGIATCGAGLDIEEARRPAVIPIQDKREPLDREDSGRILVLSMGSSCSGIPETWAAQQDLSGVFHVNLRSQEDLSTVAKIAETEKRVGDIVIASIHMGGNWGYHVPQEQQRFCRALVDQAHVDVIHGHSSHHPKAIEVYKGKPILYGCGDFLNDYEGISGHEQFRGDLSLMYFVTMDPNSAQLERLHMVPMRIRHFKLNRVTDSESKQWLCEMFTREGQQFGTWADISDDGKGIELKWENHTKTKE